MAPLVAELGTGGLRGDAEKWRNGGSVNPRARRGFKRGSRYARMKLFSVLMANGLNLLSIQLKFAQSEIPRSPIPSSTYYNK